MPEMEGELRPQSIPHISVADLPVQNFHLLAIHDRNSFGPFRNAGRLLYQQGTVPKFPCSRAKCQHALGSLLGERVVPRCIVYVDLNCLPNQCNGFSAGVNPDDFRGPGFASGYDPVWSDLLMKHTEQPFHALVGGGDQLYCDAIVREPELQEWVTCSKPEKKKQFAMTEEMLFAIDRFYFNHYCQVFRSGAFARANSSM